MLKPVLLILKDGVPFKLNKNSSALTVKKELTIDTTCGPS
jgi:hypothetical protein